MSAKTFASQGDLAEKKATFTELAPGAYAYTTEGDPNSGVIVGDDAVAVVDARATPVLAREPGPRPRRRAHGRTRRGRRDRRHARVRRHRARRGQARGRREEVTEGD